MTPLAAIAGSFMIVFGLSGAVLAQPANTANRPAAQGDVFTIHGVKVDVTASNASAARATAHANGQRAAFDMLMRRLLRQEDKAHLRRVEPVELNAMIQGFEIAEERASSVRYLAELHVQFNGNRVRDFLRNQGLPFSQTMGPALLVLPVMETAGLRLLWEDQNAWRQAWQNHDLQNRLVTFVLPEGDTGDRYLLPASLALDARSPAMRSIAGRYGLERAVTALLEISRSFQTGGKVARIAVIGAEDAAPLPVHEFPFDDEDKLDEVLAGAVETIVGSLNDRWKEKTLIRLDESAEMELSVPLRQVEDWPEVGHRLDRVTLVQGRELVSFRAGEAVMRVNFVGGRDQVQLALGQAGLLLHERDGKNFLMLEEVARDLGVRPVRGQQPSSPPPGEGEP